MKINIKRTPQTLLFVKMLSIVGFLFLVYLIANLLYLHLVSYRDIQNNLKKQNARILSDLIYKNGKWDTSNYVNDIEVPQNNPLYVITTTGFVIDRETPISGFLDSSDINYSSSFSDPQTIVTPAGEAWRMFSKTVTSKNGNVLGVVTVGWYKPEANSLTDIDAQLKSAATTIVSSIKIQGDSIDASNVDVKNISIFISYEVVDHFNNTLQSVGGLPAYIDRSFLPPILKNQFFTLTDNKTNEEYSLYSSPINIGGNIVGGVVSGFSLKQVNKDFQNELVFSVGTGITVIILLIVLLGYLLKKELTNLLIKAGETAHKVFYVSYRGGAFGFDKDTGVVYLGDLKMEVPVKTKQYYICKILFTRPNKNWENDEIIDRIPEGLLESEALDMYDLQKEGENLRKKSRAIYDAIRLLNAKALKIFSYELVLIQGKTYRINPNIQPQK